jgi:hypothetical protein
MLGWLSRKHKKQAPRLPAYSALRTVPSRRLPQELIELEQTTDIRERAGEIQSEMREAHWPGDDQPLVVELVTADGGGVTIPSPDFGGQCLVVFTSPFRAMEYVEQYFANDSTLQYLSSSAAELARMLRDIRSHDIGAFILDRCPRCEVGAAFGSGRVVAAADVLALWSIVKSSQYARAEFYVRNAMSAATRGDLDEATEVLLETVGHVTPDDPRLHVYLGELAAARGDDRMLREAKCFLSFLDYNGSDERFERAAATRRVEFDPSL